MMVGYSMIRADLVIIPAQGSHLNKAKVEPKTVLGILRHSRIQTTLDLYTQEDGDEARAAQGEFFSALGMSVQAVQQ